MLALEIRINESKPLVIGADILLVYLNRIETRDDHGILASGADDAFRYKWIDKEMKDGDKVFIRVVDVEKDEISSPFETNKCDREEMKQRFEKLKKELQDKQLL